jgi:hypothetical protein
VAEAEEAAAASGQEPQSQMATMRYQDQQSLQENSTC